MRWNGRRLGLAAQILFCLFVFATLCAELASLSWTFELFAHFRAQYFFAGLLIALDLWLVRHRLLSLAALALTAWHAIVVVPAMFAPAQAAQAAPRQALRVLSINVFGYNDQHRRMLDYVRAERPDVLIVIEVTPSWGEALQALRSEYAYSWVLPTGVRAGMAMLSREQPIGTRLVDLGNTGEPSMLMTVRTADGPVSVLGTHLYWPLGPGDSRVRNTQLAGIARVARETREPLLVAGDLNVTPFSPQFTATLHDGGLRSCADDRLVPTWPARIPFLFIQIDHCLVSDTLAVRDFHTGPYVGSDHYPIVMEVGVEAPPATAR